jgi:hypothetical protein
MVCIVKVLFVLPYHLRSIIRKFFRTRIYYLDDKESLFVHVRQVAFALRAVADTARTGTKEFPYHRVDSVFTECTEFNETKNRIVIYLFHIDFLLG